MATSGVFCQDKRGVDLLGKGWIFVGLYSVVD